MFYRSNYDKAMAFSKKPADKSNNPIFIIIYQKFILIQVIIKNNSIKALQMKNDGDIQKQFHLYIKDLI